jgi:hypothetical protein
MQRQFWNVLFFGLFSSFVIYNVHFGAGRAHAVLGANGSSKVTGLSPVSGKQHLLVTSAAPLERSTLALALLEEGHAVTLLADASSMDSTDKLYMYNLLQRSSSSSSVVSRPQIISCNAENATELAEVVAAAQPDAVVLLAGQAAGESRYSHTLPPANPASAR